jgi:hypothetical protein
MNNVVPELNKKQNGGARPGAGRPKGVSNKLRVTDFFNGDERDQLILEAKLLAFGTEDTKPDKDMVKFLFEQLFGKATQKTITEDNDGNRLAPLLVKILKDGGDSN